MNDLEQLGRTLAGLQDRRLAELRHESPSPSPALGEHLLRRSMDRRRNRRIVALSLTGLVLAASGLAGLRLLPNHKQATLATVRAQAGQRVAANALDMAVAFDDGSEVLLSSGASLRTEALGVSSATLELERGQASVRVVHTRETRWSVRAGSYTVAVTGTRFRVGWHPESGKFSVTVEDGSVLVSGGLLRTPLDIRAGQSISLEQGRTPALGAAALPASVPSGARASAMRPPAPEPEELAPAFAPAPSTVGPPGQPRKPAAHRSAGPSWLAHAEAGHYRDALAEAERRGFDAICREATATDLLTLAEAARYAGNTGRAEQALRTVRARFHRDEDAATAAYLLGRIAAENRRDSASAARWFRTYLTERPGGRLNREAEGRLLESLAFMDSTTARQAARVYLEHYPTGPHAGFARNLLGN
jgi:transmembrane sensor